MSPRLGARDPRLRANQQGLVADEDLDPASQERDGKGRTRFRAWDPLRPLPPNATLSQVIAQINAMLARGKGQL